MIEIFDNVLNESACQSLIDYFEECDVKIARDMFDEVELPDCPAKDDLEYIIEDLAKDYWSRYDKHDLMPRKKYAIEGFRIKRYTPNIHEFPIHADSVSKESSTRFLAFLFYLNDNEAGTEFDEFTVESKMGRVLIFPPYWMFPHRGIMPTETTKYIMSSYLHFI